MMNAKHSRFLRWLIPVAVAVIFTVNFSNSFKPAEASAQNSVGLTGNWAVKVPRTDGTFQWAYFNLKEDGGKITGSIRVTQFYYLISESTGSAEGFTITGKMRDGNSDRKVKYEGKLVGEELHLSTRRRPEDKPTESVARRAPDGEGAMPARLPLPTLHRVPY